MASPEHESAFFMNHQKTAERQSNVNTILLLPNGFGFGDGSISTKEQLAHPERSGLTREAYEIGMDIILNDPRIWVPVEAVDDGCGDGRPASVTYRLVPVDPAEPQAGVHEQVFKRSLPRAKIFGGGLVVASSMLRASVWGTVTPEDTVLNDRIRTVEILKKLGLKFGAHTDNHAHGQNCGCGAIDKYPEILGQTLRYRSQVSDVVKTYVGDTWDPTWQADLESVYESYHDQQTSDYLRDAEGRKTMDLIEESGSVVKELVDDHLEDFDVLNDEDGVTLDQRVFDAIMHERGVAGTAQLFVVDLWRGRKYARAIARYASEEHALDYDTVYRRNMSDFLARSTNGPSATLTDGTQPVFLRT